MALSCRQTQKLLCLYRDRVLPAAKTGAVEEHLGTCPVCRAELATWEKITAALAGAPVPALPGDFTSRVMSRLTAAERHAGTGLKRLPFGTWARPAATLGWLPGPLRVAAAVAALAVLLYGAWSYTAREMPPSAGPAVAQKAPQPTLPAQAGEKQAPEAAAKAPTATRSNPAVAAAPLPQKGAAVPSAAAAKPNLSAPTPAKAAAQVGGSKYLLARQEPPPAPYQPRAFLNKERLITSTFLRVQVADLNRAEAAARASGQELGAKVEELARGQAGGRAQLGLKFTVETSQANTLLVRLTGLGRVLDRNSETRDITADFASTLKLYHYWIGLRNTLTNPAEVAAVEREIARLEKQLGTWEDEAAKQVIVLWLEEE